ncbi:hypothetical protein BDR22DRAFT_886562 [Usnea florida]
MKHTAQSCLFLVSLFSLVVALPTKPPGSQGSSLSLVDVSLQLNETHLNPLNSSQIIHYNIPQTQYSIYITTGMTIGESGMLETLSTCLATVQARISKYGNVFMSPDPNVFFPKVDTGLEITVESTMVPGLLWSDVANMIHGTLVAMIFDRALYRAAQVELYDEPTRIKMGIADLHKSSQRPLQAGPVDLD